MIPDAFDLDVELPNKMFDEETATLLGFDVRYNRIERQLRLISDPDGLRKWTGDFYRAKIPPIVALIASQYPLFVLEGDVGTGKTAFARGAASRICGALRKEGRFFALSSRVRGSGLVGEASSRINEAFDYVTEQLGKSRLVFLLIDEADSLLTTRSDAHSHLEDRVAVNTIIQKVDDLRRYGGRLVVFLATNRIQTLDAAILRRVAIHETFERPNDEERLQLLRIDLADLGLTDSAIQKFAKCTGPSNDYPGYTFSDFRTRLLPRIVANAFPERMIMEKDILAALETTTASPRVS